MLTFASAHRRTTLFPPRGQTRNVKNLYPAILSATLLADRGVLKDVVAF